MKSILIRDLNPKTYDAVKKLAQALHRSIQGELHAIPERTAKMAATSVEPELDTNILLTATDVSGLLRGRP